MNLSVLSLLTDVCHRFRKCYIFLSFSHSFHKYPPFYAVAIVNLDFFPIKENI